MLKGIQAEYPTTKNTDIYLIQDVLQTDNMHFYGNKNLEKVMQDIYMLEDRYIQIIPGSEFLKDLTTWGDIENKLKEYECNLIDDDYDENEEFEQLPKMLGEKYCGFGYVIWNKDSQNIIIIE